jgi:diguanylate cyclase (GGDEF)-like protein
MTKPRKTRKVLIVDDEPSNLDVLMDLLKSDYKVVAALNGERALEMAGSSAPPDLVLLDILMPEMDGYEVCEKLKANDATKNLPVIFVTAVSEVMDEARGFRLGAVDYITKPFHPPIVKARVKAHMELKVKSDMLEKLASIDGLTNLYNRRRLDEILSVEWSRCQRSKAPLSLVMIDIDFFKLFNDTYGHALGDHCLKEVAWTLKDTLRRPGDIIARYGGEEFAVLLPATNDEGAAIMANKMREEVAALKIPHSASEISNFITVSMGVATVPSDSGKTSSEDLLKAADRALYQSKKNGRNRVTAEEVTAIP